MPEQEQVQPEMGTEPTGEMPEGNPQPHSTTTAQPQTAQPSADMAEKDAELERLRAALKNANKEAAERRKALEALEKAEQERKEAEMTELQKLQAQLEREQKEREKAAHELETFRLAEMRRKAAKEAGLPDVLTDRVQGATEDEMLEDAKKLAASLPKPEPAKAQPKATGVQPTNPPAGQGGETYEQKKARILGTTRVDVFSPARAVQNGGGVVWNTTKE